MQNSSIFDEGIKIISFCPLCKAKQENVAVSILETTEVARLIHLECQKCRSAILALVIMSPSGMNSLGMITDLSAGEALKFKENPSLEVDEILAFHNLLKKDKFWLKNSLEQESALKF